MAGLGAAEQCKHLTARAAIPYPSISETGAYDIHIGENLLQEAGRHIAPLLNRPFTAIVTDENVARHHLKALEASLAAAGITSVAIILPAGRKNQELHRTG